MPGVSSFFRTLQPAAGSTDDDGALLRRFRADRDESAFAALVERHGPLVLGVAQRILADLEDAEDVFQATFLVLARCSARFETSPCVAGWLVKVAQRTALRVRTAAACRQRHEHQATQRTSQESPFQIASGRDLGAYLDSEVARLPAKYREPVALCLLQGHSKAEAAARLGWPVGTVAGRLARAKSCLHTRLARRGFTPAVVTSLLAVAPSEALVSRLLTQSTILLAA